MQTFWVNLILSLALMVLAGSASAEEGEASRETIRKLISELDGNTLAERTRAERQILDLGPAILAKLPALETVESVSARESLRRIRIQLERRAARESSGPSIVTLEGRYRLGEILTQIRQQTGNRIGSSIELSEIQMDVNWKKSTFWNCLDDLCQLHDLEWDFSKDSAAIQLSKANSSRQKPLAIQVAGPFRLAIESIETRDIAGGSPQKLLRVNCRIYAEPRLRPLFFSMAAADLKATLDNEESLAAWNPEARYEHPVRDDGHQIQTYWDFLVSDALLADKTRQNLISIRGKIHCQIAAATERVVFDQTSLARGTIRRRGGVSVRLREVTTSDAEPGRINAEVGVTVNYDVGGPAFESHRTWVLHNAVYLETKSGARTEFNDFETTQQADGTIAVDYRWQNIVGPFKQYLFVYEAPTLIINVPIEFEFQKVATGQ